MRHDVDAPPLRGTSRADNSQKYRDLVRYASLAASSHNTQPWRFTLDGDSIAILPDFSRRCPVVDPDDHHLFVSLGCAAENMIVAARASGFVSHLVFDAERDGGAVRIAFEKARPTPSPLFAAIAQRQCTRAEYDGRAVPGADRKLLERAGTGGDGTVLMLLDKTRIETVAEYVAEGNVAQLEDPRFVQELTAWIRFNAADAVRTGDGVFGRALGIPAIPRWVGRAIMRTVVSARRQNDKDIKHIRSSAGIAVFSSEVDDKAHWVDAGRRYERFALQATALGLRNAFLNQPVEVARLRQQFADWLGLGHRRPDLIVRFGYGPEMPRSLRRPVDAILV